MNQTVPGPGPAATGPSAEGPAATGPAATGQAAPGPAPAGSGASALGAGARGTSRAARLAVGVLAPLATLAIVVAGLRVSVPGGLPAVDAVAFVLTLAWAAAAAVCAARGPARGTAGPWPAALCALAGAVALTAARLADQPGDHGLARGVATVAGPLVIAASVAFVLGAPDDHLASRPRRAAAGLAAAAALGSGLVLAVAGRPFPAVVAAVIWPAALLAALPAARTRRWWPGCCTCWSAGRARSPR